MLTVAVCTRVSSVQLTLAGKRTCHDCDPPPGYGAEPIFWNPHILVTPHSTPFVFKIAPHPAAADDQCGLSVTMKSPATVLLIEFSTVLGIRTVELLATDPNEMTCVLFVSPIKAVAFSEANGMLNRADGIVPTRLVAFKFVRPEPLPETGTPPGNSTLLLVARKMSLLPGNPAALVCEMSNVCTLMRLVRSLPM